MKKNLVVVGYGGMGSWHAEQALASDVVQLLGVYDIKPERLEAAESKGIYAYPSLEAVLNDNRVDLITVATPNDVHKELCIKGLRAGKHVICEKPVMLSVEELEEVIAVSKEENRLFTVHQNRRWDADHLAVKQLHDTAELGKVLRIESRIHGSRGIPGDWRGMKVHGGGMLYDWGVHLIDQILQIYKAPLKTVYCTFDHITNEEVDDGCRVEMTFEGGQTALVEVGTHNFISMPRFYVRAENGTAVIRDWRENCQVVRCKLFNEIGVVPVKTAAGLTKTMAPRNEVTVEEYELERPVSDVHDFYRNYCRAINGEETQLVTHPQMLRVLKVIEKAFESVACGQVVPFGE